MMSISKHGDLNLKIEGDAAKDKWIELARRLNSHGPKKHWQKWVKLWSDSKNRARRKAMILDGNKGMSTILSLIECRLMIFLGHHIILDDHDDTLSQEQQLFRFFNSPDKKAKVVAKTESTQDEEFETGQARPKTYWLKKLQAKSNNRLKKQAVEDINDEILYNRDIEDVDIAKGIDTAEQLGRLRPNQTTKVVGKKRKKKKKIEGQLVKKYNSITDVIQRFIDFENKNIDLQFLRAQNETRRISEMQRSEGQHRGVEFVNYMRSAVTSALIAYRNHSSPNKKV